MRFTGVFLFILLVLFSSALYGQTGTFKNSSYEMTVRYNKTVHPGDALWIKMEVTPKNRELREKLNTTSANARLQFVNSEGQLQDKTISKSTFFQINRSEAKQKSDTLLCGLPLSTFLKKGDYRVTVIFSAFGRDEEQFSLPVIIESKEFVSETIPLDARNTSIKTNVSQARMDQINRLNAILDTKNADAVYSLDPFVPPTTATRRTSFFADRRIYAYNNGKSSTSLHYGIDYGVPTGSEVSACARGKVVMAEDRISTGWSVCIEHLPGLYSLYYHMSKLDVEVGQMVESGEHLGLSGATGLATGPHLHWEVRLNMEAVSPDFFLSDFTFQTK